MPLPERFLSQGVRRNVWNSPCAFIPSDKHRRTVEEPWVGGQWVHKVKTIHVPTPPRMCIMSTQYGTAVMSTDSANVSLCIVWLKSDELVWNTLVQSFYFWWQFYSFRPLHNQPLSQDAVSRIGLCPLWLLHTAHPQSGMEKIRPILSPTAGWIVDAFRFL